MGKIIEKVRERQVRALANQMKTFRLEAALRNQRMNAARSNQLQDSQAMFFGYPVTQEGALSRIWRLY